MLFTLPLPTPPPLSLSPSLSRQIVAMNKQETSAAANRTGGDTSDCHPGDAHKVSNVPATAEVSKGIASLPSPDKTRPEKQQLGYSLLEETPPWERQSFVDNTFNVSFQEDVGTPVATGRLTPGLRRLCLDGSPMMAWARPDRHSPFQQATSQSLVNESPPASFIDCSIAPITPTGPANTVDLPSGAGTVITVLLPDVVPLTPQNDTMDVGCGRGSPALSFVLPCPQNTVDSPCRDSATAAVANIDRLAADINGTMDLPNGTSSAGAVSDITMNGAVDLADCVGSTGATPTGQENITVEIRSDCSKTMSEVASSISTPAPEINITMEIRSDCSMTMSEVASSISTPAPEINTTVDKENDGKSTTTEVKSIVPVHHNTTVDFPNGNGSGTSDVSMTARHNGTVDLATPVSTKPAREMNSTVELVRRGNNPLTMASAKAMNITVEVLSTTTSASPSVPTVAPTTTTANDVTLAESLSASPEMMVKRPPLEVNVFMLDESLDLHSAGLVTSTPMPEHREFSFSRPAKVIGKACEARKQLVLPSNTTTPPTKTDGDPPGGDLPAAAPALPCEEGREEATAGLKQRRPQAKGILFPRVVGMSAVSGHGIKLPGLPVTRRAIPKPTCTLANSMLEVSRDGSKYVDV